jgi:cyclohexanone monooxygenase
MHTGQWPHEPVDFTGMRVAVVGTGSSGIQSVPKIAEQAEHLVVLQRTPHFTLPARNAPIDPNYEREFKKDYSDHRRKARNTPAGTLKSVAGTGQPALSVSEERRAAEYEAAWNEGGPAVVRTFTDLFISQEANDTAAEFVRAKIREVIEDPKLADLLTPRDYPIGTKRIVLDTDYYQTFNRSNVELVDVSSSPIVGITERGVETTSTTYDVDCIVFATGFDAMTGAILRIDIRGRDRLRLAEKWEAGPRTYLGIATAGFPNLFFITGPGSPSVLTNMVTAIEQHVDWLTDHLAFIEAKGVLTSEPDIDAEDAWVEHVNELAAGTLFPQANSWFLGANIPGKPRVFMPYVAGLANYIAKCDEVAQAGYVGFDLS